MTITAAVPVTSIVEIAPKKEAEKGPRPPASSIFPHPSLTSQEHSSSFIPETQLVRSIISPSCAQNVYVL